MKLFIIDFTEFYLTIHFIGAGPGDPELITLKAHRIISKSPICLYAGSLIPKKILQYCPKNVKLVDTSRMDLESILTEFKLANEKKLDVARLHSGDLSIWSALGEQTRRLKRENMIRNEIKKFSPNPKNIQSLFDMGYTFAILGSDLFVLWKWAEQMQQIIKSIR